MNVYKTFMLGYTKGIKGKGVEEVDRAKLFRAGKVIDFKEMLDKQVEAYRRAAENQDGEAHKEMVDVMIRELESVIDKVEWWFGMGKYEKEDGKMGPFSEEEAK